MENNGIQKFNEETQVQKSVITEMMVSKQAQEVQAGMIVAKRFPRDENEAYNKIMRSCRRKTLAKDAIYEYPRGGTKVEGPSIRLAEALAQGWGNIDYGIIELEQKYGESQIMAYAWDLETNTRQTKIFSVPHVRYSKKGGNTKLTDPRDIYEMTANYGARRVRACILGVIPGDIVDEAVRECQKTLASNNEGPLQDRVRKMLDAFKTKHGVTQDMIEEYVGFNTEAFTEQTMVRLTQVWNTLKDKMREREDFFNIKGVKSVPVEEEKSATEKAFEEKKAKEQQAKKEAPKQSKKLTPEEEYENMSDEEKEWFDNFQKEGPDQGGKK